MLYIKASLPLHINKYLHIHIYFYILCTDIHNANYLIQIEVLVI